MRKIISMLVCLAITSVAFAGLVNLNKGFGHGAQLAPVNCATIPLTCPLVQSNSGTLTFLGSFKAPNSWLGYGGQAMSVSGSTLYMTGLYQINGGGYAIGEGSMAIPTLSGDPAYDGSNGGAATSVHVPIVPVDGSNNPTLDWGGGTNAGGGNNGNLFTGSLVYGGKLYLTGEIGFDAGAAQKYFILSASTDLSSFNKPNGSTTSNNTFVRLFAGQMGLVPSNWQPYLGGPAYISNGEGASIVSGEVIGFGFSTFDPANVANGGGNVPVTELQNYYYQGNFTGPALSQQLAYRSFTGPFGSGTTLTLSGGNGTGPNGLTGATAATLSTPLALPAPAEDVGVASSARYQMCLSDAECRDVNLTNANGGTGSASVPDGVVASTFSALTCVACTTSVTVKPYGDNYVSVYDGPIGYGFFAPGSRSFLYVSVHQYGPISARVGTDPCDIGGGASSNNEAPRSPDTTAYRRLQITAYDVSQSFYLAKQGSQAVYAANPYAEWDFPGWQNLVPAGQPANCIDEQGYPGNFFFDPATNILYGTVYAAQNIIYEWRVNSL